VQTGAVSWKLTLEGGQFAQSTASPLKGWATEIMAGMKASTTLKS